MAPQREPSKDKDLKKHGPVLTLIRGLPGSGKSTIARALSSETGAVHLEADMFMIDAKGAYKFNPAKLAHCHQQCQDTCQKTLASGKNVIVANTFTRIWEMQFYIDLARQTDISLQIIECTGSFESLHHVPSATLMDMKARWEILPKALR